MFSWRTLLRHLIWFAFPFARAKAGNNKLAKIAMMAITTSSSMSVNARLDSAFISLQLSILHPSSRRVFGGGFETLRVFHKLEIIDIANAA